MLRTALLAASRSAAVQRLVVTAALVRRFVAGTELPDAIAATRALAADGLRVTLDHLGEDTRQESQAATTDAYEAGRWRQPRHRAAPPAWTCRCSRSRRCARNPNSRPKESQSEISTANVTEVRGVDQCAFRGPQEGRYIK
jgi:hypothetical protein